MDDLKINSKKLNLLKRSNELLEKTKKNYKKYENERKMLLELTRSESVNYDEWENTLISFESSVNSNEIEGKTS